MIDTAQLRKMPLRARGATLAALAITLMLMLAAPISSAQTYSVLYTFQGQSDGGFPNAGVYRDASGNLYGITNTAGNRSYCNGYGCGTVYALAPSGALTVLHTFTGGADGWPNATWGALIPDPAGNLYGVASIGGLHDNGTLFRITPSGGFTVLHSFPSSLNDGEGPQYSLLRDPTTGVMYGNTFSGGAHNYGTVYALSKAGTGADVVLHSFDLNDGAFPQGDMATDGLGNIYGTAGSGGSSNCGVAFKMRTTGGAYNVLHNFTCAPDGYLPGSVAASFSKSHPADRRRSCTPSTTAMAQFPMNSCLIPRAICGARPRVEELTIKERFSKSRPTEPSPTSTTSKAA
jgi:uncharacterized repeat protein (TIGR03803 family)